jgi:hypothetical protein
MKALMSIMLVCAALDLYAQSDVEVKKLKITTDINTTDGNVGIRFDVVIDSSYFSPEATIDADHFREYANSPAAPKIEVRDLESDKVLIGSSSIAPRAGQRFVQIQIPLSDESRVILDLLKSGKHSFYIHLDKPLYVEVKNVLSRLVITPEQMKQASASAELSLSEAQVDELVDSAGGYYSLYGTKLDAGWRVGNPDSATVSGYLDFSFVGRILPGNFGEFSGILSSKAKDAVAHVRLSPIVYPLLGGNRFFVKAGYELNQSGTEQRALGSLLYQDLVPNFVNLTEGFNRLRVKPLAKLGLNLLYYTKTEDSLSLKTPLAEAFLSLYYYIPVLQYYSITLEGNIFARSNKDFVFVNKSANWRWDITLGYDVPGFGTKVMAKYSFGKNDITLQKDDKILLGVLVDFIEKKR